MRLGGTPGNGRVLPREEESMRRTHVLKFLITFMLVAGLLGPPAVTASSYTTVVQL